MPTRKFWFDRIRKKCYSFKKREQAILLHFLSLLIIAYPGAPLNKWILVLSTGHLQSSCER